MQSLREHRKEQSMTIRELAAKAGVSSKTVLDIEHGATRPSGKTRRLLCQALGVAPREVAEFDAVISDRR